METANPFQQTYSEEYAQYRPSYPESVFFHLATLLEEKSLAWDCGTGTGQAARLLAPHFQRVVATDASMSQLHNATAGPRIGLVACTAEEACLAPRSVDCVVCAQSAHWFDLDRFYDEVNRVARSGAVISILGYGRALLDGPTGDLLDAFYKQMFSRYYTEQRRLVEEAYTTLPFPFEETPAVPFTIETEWRLEDLAGYISSWSSLQRWIADHGDDPSTDLIDSMRARWKPETYRRVRFPGFMRLGYVNPI